MRRTLQGHLMLDNPDYQLDSAPADQDLRRVGIHPDHWYPVAWSHELKAGGTLAVRFAGDPIVLVRPRSGPGSSPGFNDVYALEDRCAHRQVPLSAGLVDGEGLRCGYHGWTYDRAGKCTDVPYLGKCKLPNGVRSYPCRELEGLVFVFPGSPEAAATRPLPALGSVADPRYRTRRFGREVGCHYSFMHENLMDMHHQFLHRAQMGQIKPRYLGRRTGEDWLEVDYTFARTGGGQSIGEKVIFGSTRVTGWENNRDLMTIRTEYPYQGLRIWAGDDLPVMELWIVYVPLDRAQRTHRVFGLLSVRRPRIPGILQAAWPFLVFFTERIFKEDRLIVEAEQAAHDAQGADWNQEVFPPILDLRALLAARGVPLTAEGTPTA